MLYFYIKVFLKLILYTNYRYIKLKIICSNFFVENSFYEAHFLSKYELK